MQLRTHRRRSPRAVQKLLERRNRERDTLTFWLVARTGWLQDGQLMQLVRRLQGEALMDGSPHRLYQSLYQSLLAGVVGGSTASLAR